MATTLEDLQTLEDLLESLGGIAPDRVRLHPLPGTATEADLIAFNDRKTTICELVGGTLVEKGMGFTESTLVGVILSLLRAFIVPRNLGLVCGADGMLRLCPGLVRGPDVAYIAWGRIPGGRYPAEAIGNFAPDLAVEVLSRSNTGAEMARKRREYFAAGVRLVWEVDPGTRTVAVHLEPEASTVLDASQALDGGEVLPGFRVPRELGRPCRLHRNAGRRPGLPISRMIHGLVFRAAGDEQGTQRWYRQAKATKCGEMGGRESERLVVSPKRGNRPSRTPWREGDAAFWARRWEPYEGTGPHQYVTIKASKPTEGRYHDVTSRMPSLGKSGSVGALGSNPQGDPARFSIIFQAQSGLRPAQLTVVFSEESPYFRDQSIRVSVSIGLAQ